MKRLSISVSEHLQSQLAQIAKAKGCSVEDVAAKALAEYVENYAEETQADLCAVDNFERSFFLALGE